MVLYKMEQHLKKLKLYLKMVMNIKVKYKTFKRKVMEFIKKEIVESLEILMKIKSLMEL